jgi:lipopolysaccharide/colanic/teichoic acid biosynthesis glycosyltransferase
MPGLTGLWQVSGKNNLTFKEMLRLDISYEKNMSFWLDVRILLKTIPVVVQQVFDAARRRGEKKNREQEVGKARSETPLVALAGKF